MTTSFRRCPVCSRDEFREAFRRPHVLFDGHPLAGEYVAGTCAACGTAYNGWPIPEASLSAYYRELPKYMGEAPRIDSYYEEIADAVARGVPSREARILDLGAGNGQLLAALARRGYRRLEGLDPSPECASRIESLLGIPCRTGSIAALHEIEGIWDAVILTGVLEHILEPGAAIDGFRGMLAPDGAAFVLVPDLDRYVECLSTPFQEFSVEHINHFNRATLERLFLSRGWSVAGTGRITRVVTPTCVYPDIWCLARFAGAPQPVHRDDAGLVRLFEYVESSHRLLEAIEDHLDRELPHGRFMMWGAGQTASLLLSGRLLEGRELALVIDGNPSYRGRTLCGALVVPPAEASDRIGGDLRDHPILVASLREATAISGAIQRTGWPNRVVLPGVHRTRPEIDHPLPAGIHTAFQEI